MELFDTHAHYNDEKFDEDREELIQKMHEENITKIVVVGYDIKASKQAIEIAQKHNFIYAGVGIHPSDIEKTKEKIDEQIQEIEILSAQEKVVAIGEIGLDYHWEKENKELQKYAFIKQIELANKLGLPIIIHTRDAIADTIEILKTVKIENSGVLHCCTLNNYLIKEGLETGLYTSFGGPITYKNTKNLEFIKDIPDDRILIETDSPYLSPEPNRGKRNDSRNVKYVAEKIAEIKQKTIEEIAKITYENGKKLFRIK